MKHRKLQLLYVLTIRWINFEYSTVSIYGKQKTENLIALRTRLIGSHGWTKGTYIINQWRKDGKIVFLFRSVVSALWDPHISSADAAPPRLLLITPPYRLRNHRACYLNSELHPVPYPVRTCSMSRHIKSSLHHVPVALSTSSSLVQKKTPITQSNISLSHSLSSIFSFRFPN